MSARFIVEGPFDVQIGRQNATSYEVLGHTLDGAEVSVKFFRDNIMTDAGGQAPVDYGRMGEIATVRFTLVTLDRLVYDKLLARLMGRGNEDAPGQSGPMGELLGAAGLLSTLRLNVTRLGGRPYRFPFVTLDDPNQNLGSKHSQFRLSFTAIRYFNPANSNGENIPLWTHT